MKAKLNSLSWHRYNTQNKLDSLTCASAKMPSRDELLQMAQANIPSAERIQQIHSVVLAHTIAEETDDIEATMATLIENPIYEDVASGKTFVGHQGVMDDYKMKYKAFPKMKRHITNMMIDKKGCFVELVWDGSQKEAIAGFAPPKKNSGLYLPISVYFEVNDQGKIARETVYYDQYLMLLNLQMIPDILNRPLSMAVLNPSLISRKV